MVFGGGCFDTESEPRNCAVCYILRFGVLGEQGERFPCFPGFVEGYFRTFIVSKGGGVLIPRVDLEIVRCAIFWNLEFFGWAGRTFSLLSRIGERLFWMLLCPKVGVVGWSYFYCKVEWLK